MAQGWDSYFHDLPPLGSEPGTLRSTSESEGSLSQHLENFTGHHDFPATVASQEASETNSNFNLNYYSNSGIGNSSSDCVYQRYYKETPWQADGDQMEKEYLPRCGNGDIDFSADGLSTPESLPADLQGLKQDCGILDTSFLEDYSDVSSCSDADVGETRPSCKFMAGNSLPKPKTDISIKHNSSDWLFTDTGNMTFPTEGLYPNLSEINAISPSPSNVKAGQSILEYTQDKTESPQNTVTYDTGHNQSSKTFNMVTTTDGENVEDRNNDDGCQDQKQKDNVKREVTQGDHSNFSTTGCETLTGDDGIEKYPDDNVNEQIAATASNIITAIYTEQGHLEQKVLSNEIKESFDQESGVVDNTNSTDDQDGNKQDEQDKSEVAEGDVEESLQNKNSEKQKSPNPNSNSHGENTRQSKQDKRRILEEEVKELVSSENENSEKQKSPNPNGAEGQEESMRESTQEKFDVLKGEQEKSNHQEKENKSITSQASESLGDSDENVMIEQGLSGSCLEPNGTDTDLNSCVERERTGAAEKSNITSCQDPGCNGPDIISNSVLTDPMDDNKPSIDNPVDPCLKKHGLSKEINPSLTIEMRILPEKNIMNPLPDNGLLATNDLDVTENPCLDNEENISIKVQQQSPNKSTVALEPGSVGGDVAENTRESFKEPSTLTEEPSVLSIPYGEPLSMEHACDTDETPLDKYKDSSVARPDSNCRNNSKGRTPKLKSSLQMRKCLQPVVILKSLDTTKVKNTSNSYHCAGCQHTTSNADHLIEHHHHCHSMYTLHCCKSCNLYFLNEDAENHLCTETKENPQRQSGLSVHKKRKRHGRLKCIKCGLVFSKFYQYVKHMRLHTGKTPYKCNGCGIYFAQSSTLRRHKIVPGRCKLTNIQNSDVDDHTTKAPPQKKYAQKTTKVELHKCCVKLVDVFKTNRCHVCGKFFLTAEKAKQHVNNVHKGNDLVASISESTTKSDEKSQKGHETKGKYRCPLCPRLFKYSYNRARHLRFCVKDAVVGGKDKVDGKYRCPLCSTTFTLPSNRYRHINTFCLKECVNRLAKENAIPRQNVKLKMTMATEQKTQSKEDELTAPFTSVQKKQAVPTSRKVPRYKCSLCPAAFFHASGKYRHMKKHELYKLTGKGFKYRNSFFSNIPKPAPSREETEKSESDSKPIEADGSQTLTCTFCGKCCSTLQSLKNHERNHRGERPYCCLECGKGFKRRDCLMSHKIVHQKKIQCTVCKKILPTIRDLIQHRRSHLKRGMLQCPECPVQFQYPAHLLRHLRSHKRKEIKASQREERSQQQSLETVGEKSQPNQLHCSLCKEVFDDAQVLRKHCFTHISGSSSHQCPFCEVNFTSRRNLLRHMNRHTGDKPFSCNNCGKQFYRGIYLRLHSDHCLPTQTKPLVTMNNAKTKGPHQCSICPRLFNKKIRLKSHLHGHKMNTLLLCTRCGQYFGYTKLNFHQKNCVGTEVSTGMSSSEHEFSEDTSQTSPIVDKKAPQPSGTKLLLKCPHCIQRFKYRSLLLRHLVSHTGVQPYPCVHCGHRFGSRTMCLQHEAFCDGVYKQSKVKSPLAKQLSNMPTLREAAHKPHGEYESEYKCKFCTKTFMKSRNLRRHILTHNEVKPYRCKACDSCFSRYDHLKVHQSRCKGKKARLEVCIPKISLDDVGTGWQNKLGIQHNEKQDSFKCHQCPRSFSTKSKLSRHNTMFHMAKLFKCLGCGSSFAHEKSLKKHRKMKRCRITSKETKVFSSSGVNPPKENVTQSFDAMRNRILQRIQPNFNKKYKYLCNYCPRAFGNSYQLGVHTRLHTGERPYACEYCGLRFIRRDYVLRHFQKCTKKKLQDEVLCDRCGGSFPQVKLDDHKTTCTSTASSSNSTVCQNQQSTSQSPPKGFSCAYCNSRFLLFSQLQEHFLNAHKMETMVPPVSTAPLQHHLSNIPKIKEEPLDEPLDKDGDDRPSDGTNLICRLDATLDRKVPTSLSCPECNLSFLNKAGLAGHLRVHARATPYSCKTCNRGFWNRSLLRTHYRKCRIGRTSERHTDQQMEVPLKAELDFALNDSVLVFKEGTKTTGTGVLQTNFSCKEDSTDEPPQTSEENEAKGTSSKEKKTVQYQCSHCDKSFTDGLMLISHLEDHGREEQEKKRNTCTKCGQVCASRTDFEKHMRSHGIDENYSCQDCFKMFYTATELEAHRTCHDLNRPYGCKLCSQRFWTRSSLCSHYSEDHPDDVFSCRFCHKTYAVKKSLSRHYKKWHQEEQQAHGSTRQERRNTEKQPSSQISTTGESDEDDNNCTEDSDSDSAPYFPCHVCGKTFPTSESLEDHQRCHLGEKPHECAECGKCFFHASQLQQHQRMHKSEFQCQACGRGFVSLFALRKHKHTHGKSRPYRCSKCPLSFPGPSQLAEHMSTHRDENFPCDICNSVFLSKSSRAEHRKLHSKSIGHQIHSFSREHGTSVTQELKYRCGVCSERFRDPEKLSEHGCMAAKERPYSCSDCDKHFLHASHLKKHRSTHQTLWSNREYPCNQCKSRFSSAQHFLSHLKSHVDTTAEINWKTDGSDGGSLLSFMCPVCHQCFARATELISHFPRHMEDVFECKICKMPFPSRAKLEEHGRCHLTAATPLECIQCGQSFLGRDAFHQHQCSHQRHKKMMPEYSTPPVKKSKTYHHALGEEEEVDVTGEDLHNCPVCSKQFSSKSGLLEHQNKHHTSTKPFNCGICGKAFALRRYLKEHERRHRQREEPQKPVQSAENKLKCTQCNVEFKTAHDLSLHMRFHAEKQVGEYRCDMCYKSFSQWPLLKQHQESHVGQVVYECNECDKAFAFPHLLEEHQQTHAGSSR